MQTTPPPIEYPYTTKVAPRSGFLHHFKRILLSVAPFFIKIMVLFVMFLFAIAIFAGLSASLPQGVQVTHLNNQYNKMVNAVNDSIDVPNTPLEKGHTKKVFLLSFTGDVAASALSNLREEITVVLQTATPADEIIVKVESGGGFVHSYGLAASQLKRIKDAKIPLTIIVDKVAASGGYMMACMADTLIAAPFAILGSIGVVAEFPNFSGWLKRHGITYEQYTSGEYKRTVSPFTEPTEKAQQKMMKDLAQVHKLFKDLVTNARPDLDITKVSTGEIWYGTDALENSLIDTIATSDDILMSRMQQADVYLVRYLPESTISERMANSASIFTEKVILKISENYINNQ